MYPSHPVRVIIIGEADSGISTSLLKIEVGKNFKKFLKLSTTMYQVVHKTITKVLFVAPLINIQKILLWNRTHVDLDVMLNDEHLEMKSRLRELWKKRWIKKSARKWYWSTQHNL